MTQPSFCSSCGQPAGAGGRFCSSCGEPLTVPEPQTSPLTDPVEAEPVAEVAVEGPATARPGPRRRPLRYALAAVGALVLVGGLIALLAGGGGEQAEHAAGPSAAELERAENERCVRLWNTDDNSMYRTMTGGWTQTGSVYVSVGYAGDYPDKCLITVVPADLPDLAYQFLQTGDESPVGRFTAEKLTPDAVPASAKQWNATLDSEGMLTL